MGSPCSLCKIIVTALLDTGGAWREREVSLFLVSSLLLLGVAKNVDGFGQQERSVW